MASVRLLRLRLRQTPGAAFRVPGPTLSVQPAALTDGAEVNGVAFGKRVQLTRHKFIRVATVKPNPCDADTDADGAKDRAE